MCATGGGPEAIQGDIGDRPALFLSWLLMDGMDDIKQHFKRYS